MVAGRALQGLQPVPVRAPAFQCRERPSLLAVALAHGGVCGRHKKTGEQTPAGHISSRGHVTRPHARSKAALRSRKLTLVRGWEALGGRSDAGKRADVRTCSSRHPPFVASRQSGGAGSMRGYCGEYTRLPRARASQSSTSLSRSCSPARGGTRSCASLRNTAPRVTRRERADCADGGMLRVISLDDRRPAGA